MSGATFTVQPLNMGWWCILMGGAWAAAWVMRRGVRLARGGEYKEASE